MAKPTRAETPVEEEPGHSEDTGEYTTESEHFADRAHASEQASEAVAPRAPRRPAPERGNGTGRRKAAVARVRIVPGSGEWKVNGYALDRYFPNRVHQQTVKEPLATVAAEERYDVFVRLSGGGVSGQAGAVRLGLARALSSIDADENRPMLKKAGLLTRDSRTKERKKYGLKKARKAPQYSKR